VHNIRVPAQTWSIAELAAEYDITLRTIRFYEDRGLLTPERRGTVRVYHPRDKVRLGLILRGKRLGFSLDEIATIVDMYDAEQITHRRADLEQRRRDIDETLQELAEVERRCHADLASLRTR
jgi:DNA-binding transcriptional MerR regulator